MKETNSNTLRNEDVPVCKPVGPSESREGLRPGMACDREEVRREQALRDIGRKSKGGGKDGRVSVSLMQV